MHRDLKAENIFVTITITGELQVISVSNMRLDWLILIKDVISMKLDLLDSLRTAAKNSVMSSMGLGYSYCI